MVATASGADDLEPDGLQLGAGDVAVRPGTHRDLLSVAGLEVDERTIIIVVASLAGVVLLGFFAAALRRVSGHKEPPRSNHIFWVLSHELPG